ncbi:MAG: hypothetical protein Q4G03_02590 [Planctomycetia bacterium]|nr:hypothetical protein [Planctomycetia bacterium]
MKSTTKAVSVLMCLSALTVLSGCGENYNPNGAVIAYKADTLAPSALDTSNQTLAQPKSAPAPGELTDAEIAEYARQYDAAHPKYVAAPAPAAKSATPVENSALAAKEDIDAAAKRVAELKGTVKKAKNGAIIGITIESPDCNQADMELFGRLKDLESFSCLGMNFTDEMFLPFKELTNLTSITVQNAEITEETIKLFAELPNLTTLDIRRDLQLTDSALVIIAGMPKLEKLYAYYNSFKNSGMNKLSKSETLKVVDVRGCSDVSDTGAKYLARIKNVEELYFRFNVSDSGVDNMSSSQTLRFVELQDCSDLTANSIESFKKFPALTGLRVFRCKAFGDEAVQGLAELPLQRLELRDLNVTDAGVSALKNVTTYKEVELSEIAATEACLADLFGSENWSGLETLNTFSMAVSDATVEVIANNMPNLKKLQLRAVVGGLSDAAIDSIVKLENLETLDLRENSGFTLDAMLKLAEMKNLRRVYTKGTPLADSSSEAAAAVEQFKKINPKCALSAN